MKSDKLLLLFTAGIFPPKNVFRPKSYFLLWKNPSALPRPLRRPAAEPQFGTRTADSAPERGSRQESPRSPSRAASAGNTAPRAKRLRSRSTPRSAHVPPLTADETTNHDQATRNSPPGAGNAEEPKALLGVLSCHAGSAPGLPSPAGRRPARAGAVEDAVEGSAEAEAPCLEARAHRHASARGAG